MTTLEQEVIGEILLSEDNLLLAIEQLTPDDFQESLNRKIFKVIKDLYRKGEKVEPINIVRHLNHKGVETYLANCVDSVISPHLAEHHFQLLKNESQKRRLMRILQDIASQITDSASNIQDILYDLEHQIYRLSNINLTSIRNVKEIAKEVYEELELIASGKSTGKGLETGYYDLDSLLHGFKPGQLITIGGRPSIGKTAFIMSVIANMITQYRIALFSLEMTEDEVIKRLLSIKSGVAFYKLERGVKDEELQDLQDTIKFFEQHNNLWIDDNGSWHISKLRAFMRRLKRQEDIQIVFVDYLQLLHAKKESREREVSYITQQLKEMAKELNIPIVATAQLSRKVEERVNPEPKLSDLRESGNIEQASDVVIFVWKENDVNDTAEIQTRKFKVAKHRNGRKGTFELTFKAPCMRFVNHTEEPEILPF